MRTLYFSALLCALCALSATSLPLAGSPQSLLALDATQGYTASLFASARRIVWDTVGPRLLQTDPSQSPSLNYPLFLRWRGINFVDVTDHQDLGVTVFQDSPTQLAALGSSPFPSGLSHQSEVAKIHAVISEEGPRKDIKEFTSFSNRYYKSSSGKASQQWLLHRIEALVAQYRRQDDVDVLEFPHPWGQNSIIVRLKASDAKANGTIVLGCHQDSVNLLLPVLPAPGADDDGSGVVTQLESLRALLATGYKPAQRHVEYHFNSAEEGGLLGSQAIASDYAKRKVRVDAMSQFDMTAFVKEGTRTQDGKMRMGIVNDFVSPALTDFNRLLLREYLSDTIAPVDTKLGYAASDHASWTKVGVHSSFTIENAFEDCNVRRIHTTSDTWDHPEYSFELITSFVKLSTAFVVELTAAKA
ncbi:unnamed protein product [Parajaminaea phylloscopi]